jgi:oligosaccharide translocation protein RFT1
MEKIQSLAESSKVDRLLSKSAKGVTFLLFGQVFTKLSTFILNQILITYISPKTFGINSFLEFLMNTILFFSREGIRLSSQRIKDEDDEKFDKHGSILQSIINLGYIPLMIGVPLSSVVIYWQYGKISDLFKHMQLFKLSISIIWLAIIIELMIEPFYNLNQFNLNYDKRTRYETLAITLSCFANFGIVFWFKDREIDGLPIVAFSIGKLVHSTVLFVAYYWDFRSYQKTVRKLHVFPSKIYMGDSKSYHFDPEAMNHFYKMFFNLCFKHLLTEGDKLIINSLCTIEEQGIYSLISNYGSLLARLVFAPVEESLRNFLTRLLLNTKSKHNLEMSENILQKITSFYIYLSITIGIFGPLNSGFLIQKVIGSNWSNTVSETIPLYTLYLPLLAFNGILEAVHQSTASGNEVVTYTYYMVGFSGIFMLSSYLSIAKFQLSLQGLILSNMLNMTLRIFYCYGFIEHFYKKHGVQFKIWNFGVNMKSILILSLGVWLSDVLVFGVTRNWIELFGNIVLAMIFVSFIMYKEKDLILSIVKKKPLD